MQQMEIWLVILFLSRQNVNAKQMVLLSSSMKFDPGAQIDGRCVQTVDLGGGACNNHNKKQRVFS